MLLLPNLFPQIAAMGGPESPVAVSSDTPLRPFSALLGEAGASEPGTDSPAKIPLFRDNDVVALFETTGQQIIAGGNPLPPPGQFLPFLQSSLQSPGHSLGQPSVPRGTERLEVVSLSALSASDRPSLTEADGVAAILVPELAQSGLGGTSSPQSASPLTVAAPVLTDNAGASATVTRDASGFDNPDVAMPDGAAAAQGSGAIGGGELGEGLSDATSLIPGSLASDEEAVDTSAEPAPLPGKEGTSGTDGITRARSDLAPPAGQATRTTAHAEVVKPWRSMTEQTPDQAGGFEQNNDVPASRGKESGQLQQFADAMRNSVAAGASAAFSSATLGSADAAAPATAERNNAAPATTVTSADAWRGDINTNPSRPAAALSGFGPILQSPGHSFGQSLGQEVGDPAWGDRISQRIALMAGQNVSSALIELDPPELGAMTVKVVIHGDQASVSFVSPHAVVREALESSFPRLQEMLGQQGLQLGDAQVSDQSSTRQDSGRQGGPADTGDLPEEQVSEVMISVRAQGLVDYYA